MVGGFEVLFCGALRRELEAELRLPLEVRELEVDGELFRSLELEVEERELRFPELLPELETRGLSGLLLRLTEPEDERCDEELRGEVLLTVGVRRLLVVVLEEGAEVLRSWGRSFLSVVPLLGVVLSLGAAWRGED